MSQWLIVDYFHRVDTHASLCSLFFVYFVEYRKSVLHFSFTLSALGSLKSALYIIIREFITYYINKIICLYIYMYIIKTDPFRLTRIQAIPQSCLNRLDFRNEDDIFEFWLHFVRYNNIFAWFSIFVLHNNGYSSGVFTMRLFYSLIYT